LPRLAYTNGRITPARRATVSIDDRAYLFGDGVYEVSAFFDGTAFDWPMTLERLKHSRDELRIAAPMSDAALTIAVRRLIAKSRVRTGLVYLQVTRGAAPREHAFPKDAVPGLTMTVRPYDFAAQPAKQRVGVSAITVADERWARCQVKSVALLANVLAKQEAKERGAFEAVMVGRDGAVTEGSSTTTWMVTADGTVVTRPLSNDILPGVRRRRLLQLLEDDGIQVEERAYTVEEAASARELFLSATSTTLMPIVTLNDAPVGTGKPGPVSLRACDLLWREIERQTGWRPPST
jgi:D-alanine transaminase|tara:strand:- start:3070 stop:3948 length:879 start_codon:yes stop_codon:yes gene_type:complete